MSATFGAKNANSIIPLLPTNTALNDHQLCATSTDLHWAMIK